MRHIPYICHWHFHLFHKLGQGEIEITSYQIFTGMKFKKFLNQLLFPKAKSINTIFYHVFYSKIPIIIIHQIIFWKSWRSNSSTHQ